MGFIEKAPKKIVWRAIEYYKQNKVIEVKEKEQGCYEGIVTGSGKQIIRFILILNILKNLNVHVHLPKKMM